MVSIWSRSIAGGLRANGIVPSKPGRYHIFGRQIVARCGGTAVPDAPIPIRIDGRFLVRNDRFVVPKAGVHP